MSSDEYTDVHRQLTQRDGRDSRRRFRENYRSASLTFVFQLYWSLIAFSIVPRGAPTSAYTYLILLHELPIVIELEFEPIVFYKFRASSIRV